MKNRIESVILLLGLILLVIFNIVLFNVIGAPLFLILFMIFVALGRVAIFLEHLG